MELLALIRKYIQNLLRRKYLQPGITTFYDSNSHKRSTKKITCPQLSNLRGKKFDYFVNVSIPHV